jgi:voltage-gated potassium channel
MNAVPVTFPNLSRPRAWQRWWILAIVVVFLAGSLGYLALFGWSLGDATYMTVITLTTVGFKEVRELSEPERLWTMGLALTGVGLLFSGLGLVGEGVISEVTSGRLASGRKLAALARLSGHVLVCGYGRIGSTVADELRRAGETVLVIEIDPAVAVLAEAAGLATLIGRADDDDVLRAAGILRARALVAALDSDAKNLYVVLSARDLAADLLIVARAIEPEATAKLLQAGANHTVSPYTVAGHHLARLVIPPSETGTSSPSPAS